MAPVGQRIYAGQAGGKKYFWGGDGIVMDKLYDEAGEEQTGAYADVLKANFPKQPNKPQPSNPATQPQVNSGKRIPVTAAMAEELLKLVFPDLYNKAKKLRDAKNKGKKKKTGSTDDKGKKDSDKKQDTRKLSLSIDTIASNVRTNGTLLQQQLAIQERSLDLLQKLANGTKSGGSDKDGGGWKAKLAPLLKYAIPTVGALGVGAAGAAALYMSKNGKQHAKDIWHEEDLEKYGPEKADELKRNREMSTLDRIKSVYDRIPTARQPIKEAKDRAKGILPSQPGDTQHDTKAIADAKQRKPAGKTLEIKGDLITFEAKTIRMDARTLTINSTSSSTKFGTGNNTDVSSNNKPSPDDKADPGQMPQYDQMGNPLGTTSDANPIGQGAPGAGPPSDGRIPATSQFKPDIATPNSPGSDNPNAPGYGGVQGGQGASVLGKDNVYNPDNPQTAEAIRKNDITPTSQFTPQPKAEGQFGTLKEQRAAYMKQINDNPELKQKAMALMMAEEGGDSNARHALLESAMNRAAARGEKDIGKVLGSEAYYAPYKDGGYAKGLEQIKDPKLRAQLEKEIAAVGNGSNMSNLATDNASAGVKANAIRRGDTLAYEGKNGEGFFRKDKNHMFHGRKNVENTKAWYEQTMKAMKAEQEKPTYAKPSDKLTGGMVTPEMTNMFGKDSITNMKGMGGIAQAKPEMKEKTDELLQKGAQEKTDENLKAQLTPYASETNKTARGDYDIKPDLGPNPPKSKFTDELIENKLNEEAGIQRWLGWKQIGPGVQRRKQLEQDPWNSEPGWDSPIKQAPGEIPERDSGPMSSIEGESSNSNDVEKASGSPNKINNAVNGAKKPKTIRKVDVGKYYPQYNKSDFGDPNINSGIGVA